MVFINQFSLKEYFLPNEIEDGALAYRLKERCINNNCFTLSNNILFCIIYSASLLWM